MTDPEKEVAEAVFVLMLAAPAFWWLAVVVA